MTTKTEDDGQHPSQNYLVATDPDDTSTWHLRVRNTFGQLDHKLMGDAWAALHEGFRGRKYEGPDKDEAIQKLTGLYHSENMRTPDGQEPPRVANRGGERVVIFNREAKTRPGWIHIVPAGELPNKEARIVQVLDDTALDSIYNRLQAEHSGADAPGLYGGREHFIYDPDQDSEALAWFKVFNRDADGIWAKDDGLTDIGAEAVRKKGYKFTSFATDPSDLQKVEGNKYRVMRIETVGFTNMPVGRQLLAPIMNRQGDVQINAEGQMPAPSVRQYLKSQAENAPEPTAVENWFECVAHILKSCQAKTGRKFDFASAWNLAKTKNPDLYNEAFGAPTGDDQAASEQEADAALQQVSTLANRIKTAAGMDFRYSWNFVKNELAHVFNRQFVARAPIVNRTAAAEGNMAGVQKKAEKLFSEMVGQEQAQYGVSYSLAFTRVMNREKTLRDLANYTIAPREAFEREPGLRAKLIGAGSESKTPEDATVQANAKKLFNRLVQDEVSGGASLMAATRRVMDKHTILCKLYNREITPFGAFAMEPSLRDKLK